LVLDPYLRTDTVRHKRAKRAIATLMIGRKAAWINDLSGTSSNVYQLAQHVQREARDPK